MLFIANVVFHDYAKTKIASIKFPDSLSLNATIFASVLLASRLSSNLHVFGLMSFAVEWFALFPIFRRYFRNVSFQYDVALSMVLFVLSVSLFFRISKAVVIIYVSAMAFITFMCPFWLIWIQRYKKWVVYIIIIILVFLFNGKLF